ncbi:MAG: hypothetical protein WC655_22400, partial [Candidatus Hydrogenedentales bacterium]
AIKASADYGGSISPSGSTNIAYGMDRTYTVRANSGYYVADVFVDGESIGAVDRHTFNNVTASHTISAVFTANPSR